MKALKSVRRLSAVCLSSLLPLGVAVALPTSASAFSNGQAAATVLGQTGFTSGAVACATSASAPGLCAPFGAAFDASGNLWVADAANNRVLRYSSPFGNGQAADLVIGQTGFTSGTGAGPACGTSPTASGLCSPVGVAVDASGNLWVVDFNNRVLRYSPPFSSGQAATLVIGQTGFSSGTGACGVSATATGLCDPFEVAFDASDNLWVADDGNHRVLRYSPPFSSGEAATLVIGQTGFTSGGSGTTSTTLRHPEGIAFDASGNLWVVDDSNSRVLRYPTPFSSGEASTVVIGQTGFTSAGSGTTAATLAFPVAVAFDAAGNLWVVDGFNNRVLRYPPPFSSGEMATLVIGQTGFTSGTGACGTSATETGLCGPFGVAFDAAGNLWVVDKGSNRVLRYPSPFSSGEAATLVIGQTDFTTGGFATTSSTLQIPLGVAFDSSGNLWVAERGNNRVVRFSPPFSNGQAANLVIGQTGFTSGTGACGTSATATGQCIPSGIAFDSSGNLWVADFSNNRVLRYSPPFSNGQAANLVIGQTGFTSGTRACGISATATGLCLPSIIAFDSSDNLWVADRFNNRILRYSAPFSNGQAANLVIGQTSFTSGTDACDVSATAIGLCRPAGIAFDASGNLWVGDVFNNRVLSYWAPFSNGQAANLILGQTSFTSGTGAGPDCGTSATPTGLCGPFGVSFDSSDNLWVADRFNSRVLSYSPPFSSGQAANRVIGQTDFTSGAGVGPNCGTFGTLATATGLCGPFGFAFDQADNLWVSDTGNNRVLAYVTPEQKEVP